MSSVVRLTRFDAGFAYLEHLRVVAESKDLAAKRVAMAALLLDEQRAAEASRRDREDGERRARREKAIALMRRGLGY